MQETTNAFFNFRKFPQSFFGWSKILHFIRQLKSYQKILARSWEEYLFMRFHLFVNFCYIFKKFSFLSKKNVSSKAKAWFCISSMIPDYKKILWKIDEKESGNIMELKPLMFWKLSFVLLVHEHGFDLWMECIFNLYLHLGPR